MTAKKVVELPKFGFFKSNESDLEQIKKMKKAGYKILQESFGTRIWIER
jgi:hypothetical protein